ncbi:MAG: hypothetical protein EOO80_04420, partial [Oxalobacteraceae bacterium]
MARQFAQRGQHAWRGLQRKAFDGDHADELAADFRDHTARTRHLIASFQRDCAGIESRLSSALRLQRLRGEQLVQEDGTTVTHDGLLRWLQYCITGMRHPVVLPKNPMYLDALLGGQEL